MASEYRGNRSLAFAALILLVTCHLSTFLLSSPPDALLRILNNHAGGFQFSPDLIGERKFSLLTRLGPFPDLCFDFLRGECPIRWSDALNGAVGRVGQTRREHIEYSIGVIQG